MIGRKQLNIRGNNLKVEIAVDHQVQKYEMNRRFGKIEKLHSTSFVHSFNDRCNSPSAYNYH